AVGFLLERLPPQLHLVIVTRRDPPLPLARLRARGQMTEIRGGDLQFTEKEAALFFLRIFMDSGPLVAHLKELILKPAGYTINGKALVSIIIPYYNGHDFIAETLDSVSAQTYRDIEVLIVDDGSGKSSREQLDAIVKTLPGIPIRVLDVEEPRRGPRRNLAVEQARGDFILPLDCDDHIAPVYIEKTISEFETQPQPAVVYTETLFYGDINSLRVTRDFSIPGIFTRNHLNVTALIKKSCFDKVNGYREELPGYEDWDLWIRFALKGFTFKRIPEPMFFYRRFQTSRGFLSRHKDLEKRLVLME
ncbi:MAG: glycosyltransferase, partial [bacterium]|nr:glycosyltransferase [bacterium]